MREYEFNIPVSKYHDFRLGDRIHFQTWKELKRRALDLSSHGYGVSVIGFGDMSSNVLTITSLPEEVDE